VSTNGRNVLHTACFSGAFSCAKLLCRWDADNFGQSSLRSAEDKLGKMLLKLRAEIRMTIIKE
jgi:hypothetical protein